MFHPDKSVVKKARIKDYDNLYVESIVKREEFWAKEAGNMMIKDTLSSYINDEVFTRQYLDTTISGARPVKYARRDGTQYVLMLLEPEKVASWYDQMSDALEKEALRSSRLLTS